MKSPYLAAEVRVDGHAEAARKIDDATQFRDPATPADVGLEHLDCAGRKKVAAIEKGGVVLAGGYLDAEAVGFRAEGGVGVERVRGKGSSSHVIASAASRGGSQG